MRRRLLLRRWVPSVLLVFGCQLSLGASWFVASTEEARARAAFQADAQEIGRQIQNGLTSYMEVVRAGSALFAVSPEINYAEFRAFVAGLQLRDRYPGLEAIGFAQRVNRRDLQSFLRVIRLDGIRRFRVWPAGGRPEYYPISLFEPRAQRAEAVLGFDMWTNPIQREAMERARDTGQPTASDWRDASAVEEHRPPDLVLYIPVYRVRGATQTVEQRRRAVIGFVFGPFKLDELLPRVVTAMARPIAFEIYDGTNPAALIYRSLNGKGASRFRSVESVQVAGRDWRVALRSSEPPVGVMSPAAWRTLFVGLLLSLLLFLITRGQVRAWETAAHHEAEVRAADRAKDEFLAILSHELRTPLNTVLGWLTMLRTGSMREDQRAHALEVIERNVRLQAQLIEDLLDVSRIVMGKVRVALCPLAVAPAVSTVLDSLRPTAQAKGVSLHLAVGFGTARILGDAARIQQIVWNLLSNAIKFTPPGGHVSVELTQDDRHVLICIRDTGIGIRPEFLPHVFERFRQADSSTTRPHSGVGLGLSIVRDLVALHGGSIEARSEGPDRGALFEVRLPAMSASPDISSPAVDPPRTLDGVRVLVVDDDAGTRDLLSQALAATGARVTTADSAREAFDLLTTQSADVLVSDIGMPEEDGFSLMRRIRSLAGQPGRIPAIALTAYARPEDCTQAIQAGYQLHFAKPVELAALQAALATLTGLDNSDTLPTLGEVVAPGR